MLNYDFRFIIDDLKEKIDFESFYQELTGATRKYEGRYDCCFCGKTSKRGIFIISQNGSRGKCFSSGCLWGGDIIDLYLEYNKIKDLKKGVIELCHKLDFSIEKYEIKQKSKKKFRFRTKEERRIIGLIRMKLGLLDLDYDYFTELCNRYFFEEYFNEVGLKDLMGFDSRKKIVEGKGELKNLMKEKMKKFSDGYIDLHFNEYKNIVKKFKENVLKDRFEKICNRKGCCVHNIEWA